MIGCDPAFEPPMLNTISLHFTGDQGSVVSGRSQREDLRDDR